MLAYSVLLTPLLLVVVVILRFLREQRRLDKAEQAVVDRHLASLQHQMIQVLGPPKSQK